MRVMTAMSGGIDSTTAAAKLCEEGHEVVGLHMRIWRDGAEADETCSTDALLKDARETAERYGFEIHEIDLAADFKQNVVDYFIEEYLNGRTPNPCVHCNRTVKFGLLMEQMERLGCEKMATGHYTRVGRYEPTDRWSIQRMEDYEKDQTYFLSCLTQRQLSNFTTPLAGMRKEDVRDYARRLGLSCADKPESNEICFLPGNDYRAFMAGIGKHAGERALKPGEIVDRAGNVLGRHDGLANFTVGQRRGLGIAHEQPLYVLKLDMAKNQVIVGKREETLCSVVWAADMNWMGVERPVHPINVAAQIRYRARPTPGVLHPREDGKVELVFDQPVTSPAPGQALAFYDPSAEWLLGGGWII
ncbi:tRNA 2-thiouridine(34) synthase MnmA [Candidatus Sumerlaeota bacterium]|nr:tRNA 2-thiouridine(34) synthase MnmA [Candidatus Sumerlaeota bacterium]